jgi:hypothetical protein
MRLMGKKIRIHSIEKDKKGERYFLIISDDVIYTPQR